MEDKKRTATDAIMDFLDWLGCDDSKSSEYERGIKFGLMIAEQLAAEVERNA